MPEFLFVLTLVIILILRLRMRLVLLFGRVQAFMENRILDDVLCLGIFCEHWRHKVRYLGHFVGTSMSWFLIQRSWLVFYVLKGRSRDLEMLLRFAVC